MRRLDLPAAPGRARLGVAALGRALPPASAGVIVLVGLFLAARGASGIRGITTAPGRGCLVLRRPSDCACS